MPSSSPRVSPLLSLADSDFLNEFLAFASLEDARNAQRWTGPTAVNANISHLESSSNPSIRAFYEGHPSYFRLDDVVRLLLDLKFAVKRHYIAAFINARQFSLALEVGCGIGDTLPLLSLRSKRCIGVDLSLRALRLARHLSELHGYDVPLVLADVSQIPVASAVADLVVCSEVFEHLLDDRACFREISRVVKRHGVLIGTVPYGGEIRDSDLYWGHFRRYLGESLGAELGRAGLHVRRVESFSYPVERLVWPRIRRAAVKIAEIVLLRDSNSRSAAEAAVLKSAIYRLTLPILIRAASAVDGLFAKYRGRTNLIFEAHKI